MNQISQDLLFQAQFEPKRSYRFLLEVDGIDTFIVKKVILPKLSAENGEAKLLSLLEIEFWDPIAPSGAQQVLATCKKSSVVPLDFYIKVLDANGTVISKWSLLGSVVEEVDFGNLDYEDRNLIVIKAKFKVKEMVLDF